MANLYRKGVDVDAVQVTDVSDVNYVMPDGTEGTATEVWVVTTDGTPVKILPSVITLSGTITNSTDGTLSISSYSVNGAEGDTGTVMIVVSPPANMEYNSDNPITVPTLDSLYFDTPVITYSGSATVQIGYTIPGADATSDMTISGTAGTIMRTLSGTVTGTVSNADYGTGNSNTNKSFSFTGAVGATGTLTVNFEPNSGFIFNATTNVMVDTTPSGFDTPVLVLDADGGITLTSGYTIPSDDSANDFVFSGAAIVSNQTPTVSLGASTTTQVIGANVLLTAVASDADGDDLTYSWATTGDGCTITDSDSTTQTVTKAAVGSCNYAVTVSDGSLTASDDIDVTYTLPSFTCADAGAVSFSVNSAGTVVAGASGNFDSINLTSENCNNGVSDCNTQACTATYSGVVPSGYSNSGVTLQGCTFPLTRPAGRSPWGNANWSGVCSANCDGFVSCTQGNAGGSISYITSRQGSDQCGSCSNGSHTVVVSVPVPSGQCNSGNVSISRTATIPAGIGSFSLGTWNGSCTAAANGSSSCSTGNSAGVVVNSNTCGTAAECSAQSCSSNVTVTIPSGYCNTGTVSGNRTTNQPQTGTNFSSAAQWTGSFSVNVGGTISFAPGNLTGATFNPSSFSSNASSCTAVTRVIQVKGTVNDSSFCNNGSFINGFGDSASQPAGQSNWSGSDWTGSCDANASGTVTCSQGNATSVTITFENCGTAAECNTQNCQAVVTLGVPSGFCNSGSTVSHNAPITQAQTGSDYSLNCGSLSISSNGTVNCISGFVCSPTSFPTVSTPTLRSVNVKGSVPSGFCNSGDLINQSCSATQPSNVSCNLYSLTNTNSGFSQASYTRCNGTSAFVNLFNFGQTSQVCAQTGTVSVTSGSMSGASSPGTGCTA